MIYKAIMEPLDPNHLCDGCGCEEVAFEDVLPIEECVLTPGDPSPAGRCPHCEGLVYPKFHK